MSKPAGFADTRWRPIFFAFLAVIGGGGLYQVAKSGLYYCGKSDAGTPLKLFVSATVLQCILYFAASTSTWCRRIFLASQAVLAGLLLLVCVQLAVAHPELRVVGVAWIACIASVALIARRKIDSAWAARVIALASVSLLLWFILAAAATQFLLYRRVVVSTTALVFCMVLAAVATAAVFLAEKKQWLETRINLGSFPPASLLLIALLRAKLPDTAYDTLLYKGTLPLLYSDWHTAVVSIFDASPCGFNFQEIAIAFIRMTGVAFNPSLISAVAYALLFFILPAVVGTRWDAQTILSRFCIVTVMVLTEVLIAQGTVYQEPLLALLLALSLLATPSALLFFAAAFAVKPTAVIVAPLIAYGFLQRHAELRKQLVAISVSIVLGLMVVGGQLYRNIEFTGRIFGEVETLAKLTDPPGPQQLFAASSVHYVARGGWTQNFLLASCNVWALDVLCPISYEGRFEAGFHMLPSSRGPVTLWLLAVWATIAALALRRWHSLLGVAALLFAPACFYFIATEGRYHLALSFAFPAFLLIEAENFTEVFAIRRRWDFWWIPLVCGIYIAGDLLPGTFINDSWECRRELLRPVDTSSLLFEVKEPWQLFLQDLGRKERESCSQSSIIPSVLAENKTFAYVGLNIVNFGGIRAMAERYVALHDAQREKLSKAFLAAVVDHGQPLPDLLRLPAGKFESCYVDDKVSIYCSTDLAPHGKACPEELFAHGHGLYDR